MGILPARHGDCKGNYLLAICDIAIDNHPIIAAHHVYRTEWAVYSIAMLNNQKVHRSHQNCDYCYDSNYLE